MTAQQAGCTSGVISRTAVDGCSKWPFNALSVKILLDKNIGHRWGIMPMPDANIGGSKMTDTSVNRCIGRALNCILYIYMVYTHVYTVCVYSM